MALPEREYERDGGSVGTTTDASVVRIDITHLVLLWIVFAAGLLVAGAALGAERCATQKQDGKIRVN